MGFGGFGGINSDHFYGFGFWAIEGKKYKLHAFSMSPPSCCVQAVMEYGGVGYEYVSHVPYVDTVRDEFRKEVNPHGHIPVIQDGEWKLAESTAIVKFIAANSGKKGFYGK